MVHNYKVRFCINQHFVEVDLDVTEDGFLYNCSMLLDPWQSLCYSVEKSCVGDMYGAVKSFIHFVSYLNKCNIEIIEQK